MVRITKESLALIRSEGFKRNEGYELIDFDAMMVQITQDPTINPERPIDAFILTSNDLRKANTNEMLTSALTNKHPKSNVLLISKKKALNFPGAKVLIDPKKGDITKALEQFTLDVSIDQTQQAAVAFDESVPQVPIVEAPPEMPIEDLDAPTPIDTMMPQEQVPVEVSQEPSNIDNLTVTKITRQLAQESIEYKNLQTELNSLNTKIAEIINSNRSAYEKKELLNKTVDRLLTTSNSKSTMLAAYAYNIIKDLVLAYTNEVNSRLQLAENQLVKIEAVNISTVNQAQLDALLASRIKLANDLATLEHDIVKIAGVTENLIEDVSNEVGSILTSMDLSAQKFAATQLPYLNSQARAELRDSLNKLEALSNIDELSDVLTKVKMCKEKLNSIERTNDEILELQTRYIQHIQYASAPPTGEGKIHVAICNIKRGKDIIPQLMALGSSHLYPTCYFNFASDIEANINDFYVVKYDDVRTDVEWNNMLDKPILIDASMKDLNKEEVVNDIVDLIFTIPDAIRITVVTKDTASNKFIDKVYDKISKISILLNPTPSNCAWCKGKFDKYLSTPNLDLQLILNEADSQDAVYILRNCELDSVMDLSLKIIPHFNTLTLLKLKGERISESPEIMGYLKGIGYGF